MNENWEAMRANYAKRAYAIAGIQNPQEWVDSGGVQPVSSMEKLFDSVAKTIYEELRKKVAQQFNFPLVGLAENERRTGTC